jgi:hypothetical protein
MNSIRTITQMSKQNKLLIVPNTNTQHIAKRYKQIIDWTRWFRIVECLGPQCNGRKDRFDKADILEQAIDICSEGKLEWVDEIGRDHRDNEIEKDIEFKFSMNSMFTKTGKPCKTVNFKIKNSLGETKKVAIDDPADYYMFAQDNAIGIISYTDMLPYLINVSDGIATRLPHDKITYIITPSFLCPVKFETIEDACLNYKARKRQMQREFIEAIPKSI